MWRAWKNMSIFIIFPLFIPLSEWFWSWSAQWEDGLAVCRPWPRTWNSQPSTPHGSRIFRCTVACFLCSTFDQRTERERCTRVIKIPWAFAGDMWKLLSKSCQCTFPNAKNVLLISVSCGLDRKKNCGIHIEVVPVRLCWGSDYCSSTLELFGLLAWKGKTDPFWWAKGEKNFMIIPKIARTRLIYSCDFYSCITCNYITYHAIFINHNYRVFLHFLTTLFHFP